MQRGKILAVAVLTGGLGFWASVASPVKAPVISKPATGKTSPNAMSSAVSDLEIEITSTQNGAINSRYLRSNGMTSRRSGDDLSAHAISFTSAQDKEDSGTINLVDSSGIFSTWSIRQPSAFINRMKKEDTEWQSRVNISILSLSPSGRYIVFRNDLNSILTDPIYTLDTRTNTLGEIPVKPFQFNRVSWSPDERCIAFIRGGSADGSLVDSIEGEYIYVGPLSLNIYDFTTKKETEITKSDSLNGSFWWIDKNNLVYGALPVIDSSLKRSSLRPNVYDYSTLTHTSRIIIKDAYNPNPSGNGKSIAFYNSSDRLGSNNGVVLECIESGMGFNCVPVESQSARNDLEEVNIALFLAA